MELAAFETVSKAPNLNRKGGHDAEPLKQLPFIEIETLWPKLQAGGRVQCLLKFLFSQRR